MKINADFDQRVVMHKADMDWVASPMKGVSRRPLDRVGEEVARATSIVRYDPNSHFSAHVHTGGEEFYVIAGTFQDEHGDFPAGSYIRNPPNSSHTPGSKEGCTIFVKLWQFDESDTSHIRLNTNYMRPVPHRHFSDISIIPLYSDAYEEVDIQCWAANAKVDLNFDFGAEIFVLEGSFSESNEHLVTESWMRLPIGSNLKAQVGKDGARVWMKRNHLNQVDQQIAHLPNCS